MTLREQGCSTLSPDASGRIGDRWAGLEKIISPEIVWQVWEGTQRVNSRTCPLSHEVMMWVVLAMGVLTDLPIRQVFRHSRRFRRDESAPGRSSLCEARQRWGVEPLREWPARIARPLATPETPGAFSRGSRWMAIDGKDRHGVVVRVMDDTLNDPQRTGQGEVHRLITNLLDETQFPALELILLDHERWEVELVFDERKTHPDPRRAEKPAHLRSETPAGVRQAM